MMANPKIPQKIKDLIDDEFKNLMIKKIFYNDPDAWQPFVNCEYDEKTGEIVESKDIMKLDDGTTVFNEVYLEGTGLWYDILKETCKELHKEDILDYWNSMDWYESDEFDDWLGVQLSKKVIAY